MVPTPNTKVDIPGFGELTITDQHTQIGKGEYHEVTIVFNPHEEARNRKGLVIRLDSNGNCQMENCHEQSVEEWDGRGVA